MCRCRDAASGGIPLWSVSIALTISVFDNADHEYLWTGGADRDRFARYLLQVLRCGTASLERQLRRQPTIRRSAGR